MLPTVVHFRRSSRSSGSSFNLDISMQPSPALFCRFFGFRPSVFLGAVVEQLLMEFSKRELAVIRRHRTPAQVQSYLRSLPYNWNNSLRTFRNVVKHGEA